MAGVKKEGKTAQEEKVQKEESRAVSGEKGAGENLRLKELTSFFQEKGFIYGPEPELYGGIAGFYTYGPLGTLLKRNVESVIRKTFQQNGFFEVECPTVLPRAVWEASGHLGGFTDPVIKCSHCKASFRADHILDNPPKNIPDIVEALKKHNLPCPSCKKQLPAEVKQHSLMMQTTLGLDTEAYNRPETATATYLPFLRYVEFFREKMPFGVFQIGKAYRNEISPRQHVIRMREFTQAEAQFFVIPEKKQDDDYTATIADTPLPLWTSKAQKTNKAATKVNVSDALTKKLVKSKAYAWALKLAYDLFLEMGIPEEKMRLRQHHDDEKAFYADDAWDLEIKTDCFGWVECCGIHDRTDYDLKQHAAFSKKELFVRTETGEKIVPHVLEIAFGVDRPLFALLDLFYEKKEKEEGKTTLGLPYSLSPVQLFILPLVNKLNAEAKALHAQLQDHFIAVYDKSGAVGRRYLRADSIGVPYCITYDFDTLNDSSVTLRDRDTSSQVRVPLDKLILILKQLFEGSLEFKNAGSPVVKKQEE